MRLVRFLLPLAEPANLTNTHDVGSRLQYVETGQGDALRQVHLFNTRLADVMPAAGPIRIDHKGFDGRGVSGWLFPPPGASPKTPKHYPLVVIP